MVRLSDEGLFARAAAQLLPGDRRRRCAPLTGEAAQAEHLANHAVLFTRVFERKLLLTAEPAASAIASK
jgi:hypothetical protein